MSAAKIDGTEKASAIGRQRLLAAIVNVQTIGIERINAGHLNIVHGLCRPRRDRVDSCEKAFPVGPALERLERLSQAGLLFALSLNPIWPIELQKVFTGDDQLMIGPAEIGTGCLLCRRA